MLRIPCPHCGVRDEMEFVYGGPVQVTRPAMDAGDAEWTAYLFERDNPKGPHVERWCHSFGCGRWLSLTRHSVTHAIVAVSRMTETRLASQRG